MTNNKDRHSRRKFIGNGLKGITFSLFTPAMFSGPLKGKPLSLKETSLIFSGPGENDLFELLIRNNIKVKRIPDPDKAIEEADQGSGVVIAAENYPDEPVNVSGGFYEKVEQKGLKVYIECPAFIPGIEMADKPITYPLARGVVTSGFFGKGLPELSLLGINDCHLWPVEVEDPLIAFAKVAGYERGQYGLGGTEVYPLLFKRGNLMVSVASLTRFKTGRYLPNDSWKVVWEELLSWLISDNTFRLGNWKSDVQPAHSSAGELTRNDHVESIAKGAAWIFNGRFLMHPEWLKIAFKYQGDGTHPFGPPVIAGKSIGDGSLGVLEGHGSKIYYDGSQQYRYWLRADVQGEVAWLLASSGNFLESEEHKKVARNLMDYIFYTSFARQGARNDKKSSVYGLLGWSYTHPGVFYSDDNARAIMGVIGASALLDNQRWNRFIVENILANFRLCSKQGFYRRLNQKEITENGWQFFNNRDYVNTHPHYESWKWACFLWLYDKTGHQPLFELARSAIKITMDAYPDDWGWTNGFQQERVRMILPLAWLVRVKDTQEHRQWLKTMVNELLKYQDSCGAIREALGPPGSGNYGPPASNEAYGSGEATLIAENGDPVSDMLYTCNFAFFALNEAAHALNDEEIFKGVDRLADFLTRIQVKSEKHTDLDGAWFRAFDYKRWDYWAANADAGWGAWCTLTGWIQSWIVATQVLVQKNISYWDLTGKLEVEQYMDDAIDLMLKSKM